MNLAKPNTFKRNPAGHFMEWIGDQHKEGGFKYWDKTEKKEFVINGDSLFKEFRFAVLNDDMMGITGYHKDLKCGIWSNEIVGMECNEATLKVRAFDKKPGTVVAEGLYHDIINDCKVVGGKYMKSIYLMTDFFTGGAMEIHNIKASGCCQSAWRNLIDEIKKGVVGDLSDKWVRVTGINKVRQGATKSFNAPIFKLYEDIEDGDKEIAIELAMILWDYLEQYTKGTGEDIVDEEDDIPPVDTSGWQGYVIPGTNIDSLGELPEEKLVQMKEELEATHVFDATYDNICAGLKWHQDRAKLEAKPAAKFNPFQSAPKKEEVNWKEVVIEENGKKLVEFDCESLTTMAEFCKTEDGKAYLKYLPAIEAGIKELIAS